MAIVDGTGKSMWSENVKQTEDPPRRRRVRVPLRTRFRFDWDRGGSNFTLRIHFGFLFFKAVRGWPEFTSLQLESALQIGWIPLHVAEGGTIPVWTLYRRLRAPDKLPTSRG